MIAFIGMYIRNSDFPLDRLYFYLIGLLSMNFHYDEKYFRRHYSTLFYRHYIAIRNKFIKSEIIKLISSGKFLEVGFADDNLIKFFKNDFDVFGIDISEFAIKKIKEKYNRTHFKICDISKEKILFDEKFDVVCAINTVEHFENPKFALQNIFNSLKKNGFFGVYLPTQSNIFSNAQYKILYDVEEHIFRPSIKSLKELLTRLGFNVCKEYAVSFIPLKISNEFILESFNLYFGLWRK